MTDPDTLVNLTITPSHVEYNVSGFDANGFNREGHDAQGFNAIGLDAVA
jgi:hypothetical protein